MLVDNGIDCARLAAAPVFRFVGKAIFDTSSWLLLVARTFTRSQVGCMTQLVKLSLSGNNIKVSVHPLKD